MVGIGKSVEELVSLLHEVECEKEQLRVISVVGFGGLGKTTLARAVYDSPCAKERFPCRAWVTTAGRSSEIDGGGFGWILREIARQVLPREKEDMDVDDGQRHLQAALTDYLQDHRCAYLFPPTGIKLVSGKICFSIPSYINERILSFGFEA
jgi:hypothetical protein